MKQISPINIRELTARQRIIDLALTDVEDFRTQGLVAGRNYIKAERKILKKITSKKISGYDILASWQDNLKPNLKKLSKERTGSEFYSSIAKHLSIDATSAQTIVNQLVLDRRQELLDDFTLSIYEKPGKGRDKFKKQRQQIKKALAVSEKEIEKLKRDYVEYYLFNEISTNEKITILDPNLGLIKRAKLNRRIERERKNIFKLRQKRLNNIYARLDELTSLHDGLITEITDRKWDLMVVLGLRNNYEKKIAKLSDDQPDSATKRLTAFENETKKFREEQLDKMETLPGQSSLDLARTNSEEIDNLLMRIFSLTNIQKNQLVLQMKEFRELNAERKEIITEIGKII